MIDDNAGVSVLNDAVRESASTQEMALDYQVNSDRYIEEFTSEYEQFLAEGGDFEEEFGELLHPRPVEMNSIADMEAELGLIETGLTAASLAVLEAEKAIAVAQSIQIWKTDEPTLMQVYRVEQIPESYVVSEQSGTEQVAATCYTAGIPYGCLKDVAIYSDVTKTRIVETVIIEDQWFYPPSELDTEAMLLYSQEQTALEMSKINAQKVIISDLNERFKSIMTINAREEFNRFYLMAEALMHKFEVVMASIMVVASNVHAVLDTHMSAITNLLDNNDANTVTSIEVMAALAEKLEIFKNYGNVISSSIVDGNVVLTNSLDTHIANEDIRIEQALEAFNVKSKSSVSNDLKMRSSLIQSTVDVVRNQTSSAASTVRVLMGSEATFDSHNNYKNMSPDAAKQNLIADGLPLGFMLGAGVKQAIKFYNKTK